MLLAVGFEPTRTRRAEDLKSSPLDHSGKPAVFPLFFSDKTYGLGLEAVYCT